IQQAFAATKHVHADTAFSAVSSLLDKYSGEWSHMAIESCEATHVHRDQNEADMALRSDCLDQRVAELRALTQIFAKADSDIVDETARFCAIVTSQVRKDDVANTWLAVGMAAASRVSGNRALDIRRYQAEGIVRARTGDTRAAIAADEKALALAIEVHGNNG